MQICNNCQTQQLDGAIFCLDCGASLLAKNRRETTASLGQHMPEDERLNPPPVFIPSPAPNQATPTITLVVMNSGRRFHVDAGTDLLIGRKDNARGIFPDVDLGLDGGYDAGVSRKHAILSCQEGVYTLTDIGGANGTFVNGRRLAVNESLPIKSGDELTFGTLLLRIEFGV